MLKQQFNGENLDVGHYTYLLLVEPFYCVVVVINNTRCKRIQSLIQNHMRHVRDICAVSLLGSRE